MLNWTFNFLRINQEDKGDPEVQLSIAYSEGQRTFYACKSNNSEILHQIKDAMTLISYIAFFPNKNYSKIVLKTESNTYAVHYIDKRFLDKNFLGCFSVRESEVDNPFETWGVEEMMAEYIFQYFYEEIFTKFKEFEDTAEFLGFVDGQVSEFYMDWYDAREISLIKKSHKLEKNKIKDVSKKYENWWDIQIIDQYGAPITNQINFIDKKAFTFQDDDEEIKQNFNSMSISALRTLLKHQGAHFNIHYIKERLENQMGHGYCFFKPFSHDEKHFMLIMNTAQYNIEKGICEEIFSGNEKNSINNIASRLKLNLRAGKMNITSGIVNEKEAEEKFRKILLEEIQNK